MTRTDDPAEARQLFWANGLCILRGSSVEKDDLIRGVETVLGDRLVATSVVWTIRPHASPGTARDVRRRGWLALEPTEPETADGSVRVGPEAPLSEMWGGYPDVRAALCAREAASGGLSFAIDGYSLLQQLEESTAGRALLAGLRSRPVPRRRHKKYDSGPFPTTPLIQRTSSGRVSLIHAPEVVVTSEVEAEPSGELQRMLERWHEFVLEAARVAPRFRLEPGELLLYDNYRVLVGRDGYAGERVLQRGSFWTDAAHDSPLASLPLGEREPFLPAGGDRALEQTPRATSLVELTARAAARLAQVGQASGAPCQALRVIVERRGCAGLSYRVQLRPEASLDDVVVESRGVQILVDTESVTYLEGSLIGWTNLGLTIRNPNARVNCACGASFAYTEGDATALAERQPERASVSLKA